MENLLMKCLEGKNKVALQVMDSNDNVIVETKFDHWDISDDCITLFGDSTWTFFYEQCTDADIQRDYDNDCDVLSFIRLTDTYEIIAA